MKFEPKISGVRVTDYEITNCPFEKQLITLRECMEKIQRQETMDYLLDTFRFTLGAENEWYAVIGIDTIYKIAILENYPEYEQEMIEYFGDNWLKHYIRFGH